MNIKKQVRALSIKLWKSRIGVASQRGTIDEAFEYGKTVDSNTAMMVLHNTTMKVVTDALEEIFAPVDDIYFTSGMDIVQLEENETKGELAKRLYPNMTIDCAVPQGFINRCHERGYDDAARHFITAYHKDKAQAGTIEMIDGVILPITNEGIYIAAILAQFP